MLLLIACLLAPQEEAELIVPEPGQVYEMVEGSRPLPLATSSLWLEDLFKALRADDVDGIRQMAADGKMGAIKSDQGFTFRVLEYTPSRLGQQAYVEVRAIKGEDSDRIYVLAGFWKTDRVRLRE